MSDWWWTVLLAPFVVYLVVRFASAAYFRSKAEHERRSIQ